MAAVSRAQDPRSRSRTQADPGVLSAIHGDIGATGGEGAFVNQGHRQFVWSQARPLSPAIRGSQNIELAIDRIADQDAMIGVPETHRVQKSFWIVVAKLQRPTRSAIDGLVNARGSSVANAQNISGLLIDRIDIPEIQRVPGH